MKTLCKTFLVLTISALIFSGCDNRGKLKYRTSTEEYFQELPSLSARQAKKAVLAGLKENEFEEKQYESIAVGFYQCDSRAEREKLYKLSLNEIITFTCQEIKESDSHSTYWVDVQLTDKGKKLVLKEDKKSFPEDNLDESVVDSLLSPVSLKNIYGELIYDENVDEAVKKVVADFYKACRDDVSNAIESYGSSDLVAANNRIEEYKSYGVSVINSDPFKRNLEINDSLLQTSRLVRFNTYEDAYVYSIGEEDFLLVVKDADGVKVIDDVLLSNPTTNRINPNNTLRCTANKITRNLMASAKAQKEYREKMASYYSQRQSQYTSSSYSNRSAVSQPVQTVIADDVVDSFTPSSAGLQHTIHEGDTEYELAKQRETKEVVKLYAYKIKIENVDHISVNQGKDNHAVATCRVVFKVADVNAVGRILGEAKDDATEYKTLSLTYYEDGWILD